jgi:hypothetical protein
VFLNREIQWCRHFADVDAPKGAEVRPATANEAHASIQEWYLRRFATRRLLAKLSTTRARRSRRLRGERRAAGRHNAELLATGPSSRRIQALHVEFTFRLGDWVEDLHWDTVALIGGRRERNQ